jgi:hypothetical protein
VGICPTWYPDVEWVQRGSISRLEEIVTYLDFNKHKHEAIKARDWIRHGAFADSEPKWCNGEFKRVFQAWFLFIRSYAELLEMPEIFDIAAYSLQGPQHNIMYAKAFKLACVYDFSGGSALDLTDIPMKSEFYDTDIYRNFHPNALFPWVICSEDDHAYALAPPKYTCKEKYKALFTAHFTKMLEQYAQRYCAMDDIDKMSQYNSKKVWDPKAKGKRYNVNARKDRTGFPYAKVFRFYEAGVQKNQTEYRDAVCGDIATVNTVRELDFRAAQLFSKWPRDVLNGYTRVPDMERWAQKMRRLHPNYVFGCVDIKKCGITFPHDLMEVAADCIAAHTKDDFWLEYKKFSHALLCTSKNQLRGTLQSGYCLGMANRLASAILCAIFDMFCPEGGGLFWGDDSVVHMPEEKWYDYLTLLKNLGIWVNDEKTFTSESCGDFCKRTFGFFTYEYQSRYWYNLISIIWRCETTFQARELWRSLSGAIPDKEWDNHIGFAIQRAIMNYWGMNNKYEDDLPTRFGGWDPNRTLLDGEYTTEEIAFMAAYTEAMKTRPKDSVVITLPTAFNLISETDVWDTGAWDRVLQTYSKRKYPSVKRDRRFWAWWNKTVTSLENPAKLRIDEAMAWLKKYEPASRLDEGAFPSLKDREKGLMSKNRFKAHVRWLHETGNMAGLDVNTTFCGAWAPQDHYDVPYELYKSTWEIASTWFRTVADTDAYIYGHLQRRRLPHIETMGPHLMLECPGQYMTIGVYSFRVKTSFESIEDAILRLDAAIGQDVFADMHFVATCYNTRQKAIVEAVDDEDFSDIVSALGLLVQPSNKETEERLQELISANVMPTSEIDFASFMQFTEEELLEEPDIEEPPVVAEGYDENGFLDVSTSEETYTEDSGD